MSVNSTSERTKLLPIASQDGLYDEEGDEKITLLPKETSHWQTVMNLFKGTLGAGILGLPFAFKQSGLWGGIVGLPLVCFASLYCSKLLIDCKRKLQEEMEGNYSYGEIGQRCFGTTGITLVNLFVMITQLGFGCAYIIFISDNMHTMVPVLSRYLWVAVCIPVLCFLCCLRTLKWLAPFSLFANFTLIFGIGIVGAYASKNIADQTNPLDNVSPLNLPTLGIFFGEAIYCYEGIGLIIPMESRMKKPQDFIKVLFGTIGFESLILITFGSLGYLAFGSGVHEIITNDLPSGWMPSTVRGLLCFSLLMTFPVQYFPLIEILESYVLPEHKKDTTSWRESKRNILRILLVLLGCLVAVAIPKFGLFMGLIGSVGSSVLAFVFPTVFHMKLLWSELHILSKVRDSLLLLFGLAGGIAGTISTTQELIRSL